MPCGYWEDLKGTRHRWSWTMGMPTRTSRAAPGARTRSSRPIFDHDGASTPGFDWRFRCLIMPEHSHARGLVFAWS